MSTHIGPFRFTHWPGNFIAGITIARRSIMFIVKWYQPGSYSLIGVELSAAPVGASNNVHRILSDARDTLDKAIADRQQVGKDGSR